MGQPQISILVVNYRRYDLLRLCIDSIYASQLQAYEIIVVDHAADSQQVDVLRRDFPEVIIEATPENPGYAIGNNRAMSLAHGEFYFILNNDVTLDPSTSNAVLQPFFDHHRLAALQPMIVLSQDRTRLNNCGLELQCLGYAWDRGFRRPSSQYQQESFINAFSGAAVLLRKKSIEVIGDFDPDYFLYQEDVDLSLRLRNAGYIILYTPTIVVYHQYDFKPEPWRYFYLERNRWFTVLKNYPFILLIMLLPAAVFMEGGVFIYSIFSGWWREKIRAWIAVIRVLTKVIAKRRLARKSHISTRRFIQDIRGGVVFSEVNTPLLQYGANPILNIYWRLIKTIINVGTGLFPQKNRYFYGSP